MNKKVKNILNKNDFNSIINHISKLNLSISVNNFFRLRDLNKILSFMLKDKKNNSNNINLVLLKKIGSPIIDKQYKKINLASFFKNQLIN